MKIRKNLHAVAFVAAMMALGAQATPVSSDDAVGVVSAWASANGAAFANPGTAVSAESICDDDGTILYWIVTMSNGGAVIVSPDTDIDPVISVLEKYSGSFPEGHPLPSILRKDMRNRLAVIAKRKASSGTSGRLRLGAAASATAAESNAALDDAISTANAQWAKYGVAEKGGRVRLRGNSLVGGDASPYVRCIVDGFEEGGRYTFWNQGTLGNENCFNKYTTNNVVCGCVATAGAAILQFFNCTNDPGTVTSTKCTYTETVGEPPQQVTTTYKLKCTTRPGVTDWSILPPSYGGTNTTTISVIGGKEYPDEAGYDLLGRVAYNMGVLLDMAWSADGSGAFTSDLVKAFKAYGFKNARYVAYSADKDTNGKEFMKTLYGQIWCGAPVALSIAPETGSGHSVVGCGYARDVDGDEFCRVFMGWGGSADAWYKFPVIGDFIMINGAVTMIGYQDDAVVPVYGDTNIPGTELKLPGYLKDGKPVTINVDEHGYFGVRVPTNLVNKTIVCELYGSSITIDPFDADVFADEKAKLSDLDDALPDKIDYFPLGMTFKQTMESGKAVAERDGKALLIVSGIPGSERSTMFTDYLYSLCETTDLSNKFVYVYTKASSANPNEPDGDPSVAVFDPAVFEANDRWAATNGRLTYEPFRDFDAYENISASEYAQGAGGDGVYSITNEVPYLFSADDATEMTNRLNLALADGYDLYLRRHSDITVNIQCVNVANGDFIDDAEGEMKYGTNTTVWTCDTYTGIWTNGEAVAFSASGAYTNEAKGIIYSCVGWTTNEFEDVASLTNYNKGTSAKLRFNVDTMTTLTWVWDITHYRVTAEAQGVLPSVTDAVNPTESWVASGERITITAEPTTRGSKGFDQWRAQGTDGVELEVNSGANFVVNGTTVSFFVNEPVKATAYYRNGTYDGPAAKTYTLTLDSSAEAKSRRAKPPLLGDYAWGANTLYDNVFKVDFNATYVDATGGVWKCSNVKCTPDPVDEDLGEGVYKFAESATSFTMVFEWEFQPGVSGDPDPEPEPGPGPGPEPEPPTPTAITITGIDRNADGSWKITVSGAVKDCWYWLYSADSLGAFSGDPWTATKAVTTEDNPQQAAADGDVVFNASASGVQLFWRAKATSKEDGD